MTPGPAMPERLAAHCPCGAGLAPGARFCSSCGKPVARRCAGCGAELAPGHRFCPSCGAAAEDAQPAPEGGETTPSGPQGERRQVTIAFCDMVGSTALVSRLDPEEMRSVILLQRERCATAVRKHDGRVLRHLGDGVMIIFGYPEAHEDDAQRAVRAALDLQRTIAEARHRDRHPTSIRVGIATGLVVTGDMIPGALESDLSIVGDAANIAARLQELAEPGEIVVSSRTRRLLGDRFALEDMGPRELKGIDEPERPARVLREARPGRRAAGSDRRLGATRISGRDWEATLVRDRWAHVLNGEGHGVLINGEAGIGKSRLVQEIVAETRGDRPNVLRLECQTHFRNTAFSPVVEEMGRWVFGRERNRDPAGQLRAMRRALGPELGRDDTAMTLAAGLLGIETEGILPRLGLTPQQVRARTQELLLKRLSGLTARRPLILVVEDCHWIDASSGDLLEQAIAQIADQPVLALVTGRPEFRPDWIDQPHVVSVALGRLDRRDAEQIIVEIGGKPLPDEVVTEILKRTDGVPLFIEELTKTVIESGQLRDEGDRYRLDEALPRLTVPETLRDSLTARLDRLEPQARRIAQVGAIIGREFRYDVLQTVLNDTPARIAAGLDELCASGLVSSRGSIPEAFFTFKHALVQDTAARSMLRAQRIAAHARTAEVLVERFPEIVRQRPEIVAQHYEEAGRHELALDYFERAGRATLARSNYTEGISHLRHALSALRELEDTPARGERELNLLVSLGGALIATRGYAAPEPGEIYRRAGELCRRLHHGAIAGPIYYGLSIFHTVRSEIPDAVSIAEQFKRVADAQADPDLQLVATRTLGAHLTFSGEHAGADRHLQRALDLYDPARHRGLALDYAQDPRVAALTLQCWCKFFAARVDEAVRIASRAVEEAIEFKHLHTLAYARGLAGTMLPQFLGDVAGTRRGAEQLIAAGGRQPVPLWTGLAIALEGWAIGANGDLDAGTQRMRQGIKEFSKTGARLFLPYYTALLADIHHRAGEALEATRYYAEAADIMRERPEGWFAPELERLVAATLVTAQGRPDHEARHAALRPALQTARRAGHRLSEFRTAHDLLTNALAMRRDCAADAARLGKILDDLPENQGWAEPGVARRLLALATA